jgi:hypothetical protein
MKRNMFLDHNAIDDCSSRVILRPWIAVLGLGCTTSADEQGHFRVRVDQSEVISTVVHIEWTPEEEIQTAWVEVGESSENTEQVPAHLQDDGSWSVSLVGLKPGRKHWMQVVADGAQRYESQEIDLETDAPPAWLPEITLEVQDPELATGGFLVTSLLAKPSVPVIIDEDGEYVWWYQPYEDIENVIRARIALDKQALLYLEPPQVSTAIVDGTNLIRLSLDGRQKEQLWGGVGLHHDFVELPDGTLGGIAYDARDVGGEHILGDRILELRPDGTEVEIWNAWDHLDPADAQNLNQTAAWTHANALDYDPEQEIYTISLHNLNTIWQVSREGEVLWRLGGHETDFESEDDDGEFFMEQHQFDLRDDTITVFDNGTASHGSSRIVQYDLGADGGQVEQLFTYESDPSLFCYVLGDVSILDNDHRLITWSTAGRIEEIDAQSEVVWRIDAELGGAFGYTTWSESLND